MVALSIITALGFASVASAFDLSRKDNLVVYWGQNSYGATHNDPANYQQRLSYYCQDDTIDVIPISFLNVFFSVGGMPEINLANICNPTDNGAFSGTNLANCQFLSDDIKTCQSKGKIVLLSLGGAGGAYGFSSDAQGTSFADTIWNLFLGGSSNTRPFGDAVLDGVDLDIEGGGSTGYVAFVNQIRAHASSASKKYYVTAAPQCPYPDAYLGSVINAVGMDAVFVQFYNNYCSLPNYANPNAWDFASWDSWAKNTSPNNNVKVFIGGPGSSTAATSGYVDTSTFISILTQTRSQYSSFGGASIWDASQAYVNGRYDLAIKNGIRQSGTSTSSSSTTTKTTTTTTTTTSKTTTTSTTSTTTSTGSGSCSGVAAWSSIVAYTTGQQVTYNGHLWTANWWSYGDVPGGASGDWKDNGACSSLGAATVQGVKSTATVTATTKATEFVKASASASNTAKAKATIVYETAGSSAVTASSTARVNSRFFRL